MMHRERYNEKFIREMVARLKYLRHERAINQTDVYIDTDINIARIEAEYRNITVSTLADLCEYYRISLKDFFDIPVSGEEKK